MGHRLRRLFTRRSRKAHLPAFWRGGETAGPSPEVDADAERDHSKRAYALWEQAGRPDGRELEFLSQAEAELAAAELKSGAGEGA
jgi:hypothetical protein